MKKQIVDKLNLFISNTQEIKNGFTWQGIQIKRLAALLYTLENKPINCDAIKECHTLMKKSTGMFSMFKGNMSLCIAAMLSLKDNPSQLFNNTISVYNQLKDAKFYASDYLTVAAYLIAANTVQENYRNVIERSRAFYEGMKKNHWFITGQDDYIFAVMLGLSDIDTCAGAEHIELLYQRLKSEFWTGNSVQALCQVLVLGGETDEAVNHILTLRDTFRGQRIKLDKTYTLPALGVLSLLPIDGNTLASDTLESQTYLRAQRGFGSFSITNQELLLFSSAVISSVYSEDIKNNTVASISTSIASIIIAQQAAIIAATSASAAAASSSN